MGVRFEKYLRQRNYKLIYSDRYGYGVEETLIPNRLVYQWFVGHADYIDKNPDYEE